MDTKIVEELKTILEAVGIPVFYRGTQEQQEPPFICWCEAKSHNFAADGEIYYSVTHVRVELYTASKDKELEGKLEAALAPFYWEKTETIMEDTVKMYQILYEIEV